MNKLSLLLVFGFINIQSFSLYIKFERYIESVSGTTVILTDIQPNDTIDVIKSKIEDKTGCLSDSQRLIFAGRQLENGRKISYYNIKANSTLHIVLSGR